jgi:DICT domain-containing protein/GAF domain-containing protein
MRTAIPTLEALLSVVSEAPNAPALHPQMYFKPALTALSHAMEDQVLAGTDQPLIIATFQQERFYRQEAHRYVRIAAKTGQVYVLAAPETDFCNRSGDYETVAFPPEDALSQEWNLVVIGQNFASCLICQERESHYQMRQHMDTTRRFEGIWTFDRQVSLAAADLLLDRIQHYRPELAAKIAQARAAFVLPLTHNPLRPDPEPFAERLVTYLQAGQYKLLKAYRSIAEKERKESLVNRLTSAIRKSLNINEVLEAAVQELGQTLNACRCLIYPCHSSDAQIVLRHEYRGQNVPSLVGQTWSLQKNPLFEAAWNNQAMLCLEPASDPRVQSLPWLQRWSETGQISRWILAPILHQGQLVGMVELHHCDAPDTACRSSNPWTSQDLTLVEAIAPQIGVALIQASSYAHLEDLNQQLEALERTRYNLTAIVGHELRTPLATVKVCLESLATEPDMPQELRQVMLDTALDDAERLRSLVQDFLTLSQLESGRVQLHPESLPLQECVDLALSSLNGRQPAPPLPRIQSRLAAELPLVRVDGERLVEVFAKLLDNACKFTEPEGEVLIEARLGPAQMLEVTITDTGRGIEPDRLEAIFERFYQEEGALRRTAGGTGLGLAICRQIISRLGGKIWAESPGRDQGTCFHFTLPLADTTLPEAQQPSHPRKKLPARRRTSA